MRHGLPALALLILAAACSENATLPLAVPEPSAASWVNRRILVTNAEDSGPGSLRAALEEASADSTVGRILLSSDLHIIYPNSPLTFSGPQPLEIDGNSKGIVGTNASGDLFQMTVRSSITFRRIAVLFSSGVGVKVVVPEDATGTVGVTLAQVSIVGSRRHGLLVNDQPQYLVDENSTATTGSPASLRVTINGADFNENGNDIVPGWGGPFVAVPDQDGIRINEGGDGHAIVVLSGAEVHRNGDDGIEIDERGNGHADLRFTNSSVTGNGYSTVSNDKGDGVRLEESGTGELMASIGNVLMDGNVEQAFDFSENGAGKLIATFNLTNIAWHYKDAVRLVEDDMVEGGGDIILNVADLQMGDNGLAGSDSTVPRTANFVVHEKGAGSVNARFTRADVGPGIYGVWTATYGGLVIREEAVGYLQATIDQSAFYGLGTFGIIFDERGDGNLVAQVNGGRVENNGVVGIQAGQLPTGTGTLTLAGVSVQGNAGGVNDVQVAPGQVSVVITP